MFDSDSKPYKAWEKYGAAVEAAKPRGLVVVSAHWENEDGSSGVLGMSGLSFPHVVSHRLQFGCAAADTDGHVVNTDSSNPLIYDFYNFPSHYYEQTFGSHGDPAIVEDVKKALGAAGVGIKGVKRGLDHGVWGEDSLCIAAKVGL
jgi:aromatic ring-opening dioxygenase catalytic subunit (LigB family)